MKRQKTVNEIGPCSVKGVFHGTYEKFEIFSDEYLQSVGFHFGDEVQATYFATKRGPGGRIIEADLSFKNLVDIGRDDWGWNDCKRGALLCYIRFLESGIAMDRNAFQKILGAPELDLAAYPPTFKMNLGERQAFQDLLRAHNIDGIQYTNRNEPPNDTGRTAYFVLNKDQIRIMRIETVMQFKINRR